jgi:hypothetical protein
VKRSSRVLNGAASSLLLIGVWCAPQVPRAPKVIFSIDWHGRPFPFSGKRAEEAGDLRMTVLENGEVQYHASTWKPCGVKDGPEKCQQDWWMQWDESRERIFSGKLDFAEMDRLRTLLDRIDFRMFGDGVLANSGPSMGDVRISVNRGKGEHHLTFLGLFPARYRDPEHPAPLVDLICEAKTIAQQVSKSGSLPGWCNINATNK